MISTAIVRCFCDNYQSYSHWARGLYAGDLVITRLSVEQCSILRNTITRMTKKQFDIDNRDRVTLVSYKRFRGENVEPVPGLLCQLANVLYGNSFTLRHCSKSILSSEGILCPWTGYRWPYVEKDTPRVTVMHAIIGFIQGGSNHG